MSVIQDAIAAIEGQQPKERSAVWMVGEQLKDMVRGNEAAAALLLTDLTQNKEMTLAAAEKKIAERAKKNKVGNCGCVTAGGGGGHSARVLRSAGARHSRSAADGEAQGRGPCGLFMSRRTDAGWENLADKLPFQPCGDLQNDVLEDIYDNDMLGTGIMLYSRESVETADPIAQIMDAEDWGRWEKSRKRRWGARCTCSACGEEFFAGYVSDSGTSGIVLRQGEDGQIYDGYVDKGDDDAQIFFDDETIVCPRCYQSVVVTRRSELRQGRTLQALQAETLNIDGYLAVLYWMVARYQDNTGTDVATFSPHAALIVDRCGVLRRFRAVRHSNEARDVTWTPCKQSCDPMQQPYYCHGAVNGRQVGGWVCDYGPELGGTTGEKTALDKYIGAGGTWPGRICTSGASTRRWKT